MTTKHQSSDLPQLTTTEELIVQYLDGELVRKELEAMLFERLAQSGEARMLLREHLTMRGAIRSSLNDERFEITSDLDSRTRTRIEQMLQTLALDEAPGVLATTASPMLEDAPAVRTIATTRNLKRWAVRPSVAALLLLLAVSGTWYFTRTATIGHMEMAESVKPQQHEPGVTTSPSAPDVASSKTTAPDASTQAPTPSSIADNSSANSSRSVINAAPAPRTGLRTVAQPGEHKSFAQNSIPTSTPTASAQTVQPAKQSTEAASDIMFSQHFAKVLNATAKREVVVTSRDRL